jgi:hypothetical protein
MIKFKLSLTLLIFSFSAHATRIDSWEPNDIDEGLVGQIRNCSTTQKASIQAAEEALDLRLDEIERGWGSVDLVGVRNDYVTVENRVWTPNSPLHPIYTSYWREMKAVWEKMRAEVNRGINFECRTATDSNCRGGEVIAYVKFIFNRPTRMIYLCPSFYSSSQSAKESTLFHELSHYAASTDDFALDWMNREKSDLKKAVRDAYHVEQFMNEESARVLRRVIWFWFWPKA